MLAHILPLVIYESHSLFTIAVSILEIAQSGCHSKGLFVVRRAGMKAGTPPPGQPSTTDRPPRRLAPPLCTHSSLSSTPPAPSTRFWRVIDTPGGGEISVELHLGTQLPLVARGTRLLAKTLTPHPGIVSVDMRTTSCTALTCRLQSGSDSHCCRSSPCPFFGHRSHLCNCHKVWRLLRCCVSGSAILDIAFCICEFLSAPENQMPNIYVQSQYQTRRR